MEARICMEEEEEDTSFLSCVDVILVQNLRGVPMSNVIFAMDVAFWISPKGVDKD